MICYNRNCKEECDYLRIKFCLYRMTKEQFKIKTQYGCKYCGSRELKVKYGKQRAMLCTACGRIRKGKNIVDICIVDNRRATDG